MPQYGREIRGSISLPHGGGPGSPSKWLAKKKWRNAVAFPWHPPMLELVIRQPDDDMRLGDFILANMETILAAWESYARRYWQGPIPDSKRLRNDAETMLRAVVADMATDQTGAQQQSKSEGEYEKDKSEMKRAAVGHALSRVHDGFDIARMVAEFRALRASVNRIWWESVPEPHHEQIADMGRFNEAIDQLVAASVTGFTERLDRSRRLFLGILGHDLRQPLYSLRMFAEILGRKEPLPPDGGAMLESMIKCCDSMGGMLGDLLDFTTSQLGSEMPVSPAACNLENVCREVLDQVQAGASGRSFTLDASGDLEGEWDAARLRQMLSNLLSNARHHGQADHPVSITLRGSDEDATLAVHNMGPPIPPESITILFDPMVRLARQEKDRPPGSIGLGLYICRQIATAHHGEIGVESCAESGTTFTVRLPKKFQVG